jgi:hypothetical protein
MYKNYDAAPAWASDRCYISRNRYFFKHEMRKQAILLIFVVVLVCFGVISPLYLAVDVVATAAGLIR